MRRMLALAAATCLLGVARADEPPKSAPGGEAAQGKATEAVKKDGPKAAGSKAQPPAPKGDAGSEKPKPCEPVRPCPID